MKYVFIVLLFGFFTGCGPEQSSSTSEEEPVSEKLSSGTLHELEDRLLASESVQVEFWITAEGAVTADLKGSLSLSTAQGVRMEGSGQFVGQDVDVNLLINENMLRGGSQTTTFDVEIPPALNEGMLIGFTRMGLLHNLARLTAGAPPDRTDGTVRDWVIVHNFSQTNENIDDLDALPLSFEIMVDSIPSGEVTLWIDEATNLPIQRNQTVHFESGDMLVTERYTKMSVEP